MTGFNHVLTGALIAASIKHPVLAPALAFISHFVLDAIPHFGSENYKPWGRRFILLLFVDAIFCFIALGLGLFLFPDLWLVVILCTFFATLPDFLWIIHYVYKKRGWFFSFHKKIQWAEEPWGLWVELSFAALMILLIISLSQTV